MFNILIKIKYFYFFINIIYFFICLLIMNSEEEVSHPVRMAFISAILPVFFLSMGRIAGIIFFTCSSTILFVLFYIVLSYHYISPAMLCAMSGVKGDVAFSFLAHIKWYYYVLLVVIIALSGSVSWKYAYYDKKYLIIVTPFLLYISGYACIRAIFIGSHHEHHLFLEQVYDIKRRLPAPVGEVIYLAAVKFDPDEKRQARPHNVSDSVITGKEAPREKAIILIIGESAVTDRHSVYGYQGAETTPEFVRLQKEGALCRVDEAYSAANMTRSAVPMMVSFSEPEEIEKYYTEKNIVELAKENGYYTSWISSQEGRGQYSRPYGYISEYSDYVIRPDYHNETRIISDHDGTLIPFIREKFRDTHPYKFFVIHIMGSHQSYEDKRTEEDIRALPYANAYDQSIHRTDRIIAQINKMAQEELGDYVLFYTSDHGEIPEDLGNGDGHGLQYGGVAQYRVPLLVMGNYQRSCDLIAQFRNNQGRYSQVMDKFVFLNLLGYDISAKTLAAKKNYNRLLHSDGRIYTYDTLPHRP